MAKRALGVIRLSELTDRTTSPERQREVIESAAGNRGSVVVGWAEDLDVSASKVHPMERPELGAWLGRPDEYDEILFWRLDRIVRSSFDWHDLMRWADEQGKVLASATEPIDLATHLGRMVANLIVGVAEMESANLSERVLGAHKTLRQQGRFAGGRAPYGFTAAPAAGKGWKLKKDTVTAAVVLEAAERVMAGEAVNAIVADFNRRKIDAPGPRRKSNPDGEHLWRGETLRRVLRSPALLGHGVHQGRSVTGDDGMPVMRGEPLLSQAKYDQLQHALGQLSRPGSGPFTRTQTPSLLLGVAFCGWCAGEDDGPAKLYRGTRGSWNRGQRIPHYLCARASQPAMYAGRCRSAYIDATTLDEIASVAFLIITGDEPVIKKVWEPGEDHAEEIAQVRSALAGVRDEYDRGGYSYQGGQAEYDQRSGRLSKRLAGLLELPSQPARYEDQPTGQTFAQAWQDADTAERRRLMTEAGFRLYVSREAGHSGDRPLRLRLIRDPGIARRAARVAAGLSADEQSLEEWAARPLDIRQLRGRIDLCVRPGDDVAAMVRRAMDAMTA